MTDPSFVALAVIYGGLVGAVVGVVATLFGARPYRSARILWLEGVVSSTSDNARRAGEALARREVLLVEQMDVSAGLEKERLRLLCECDKWRALSARSVRTAEYHCGRACDAEAALTQRPTLRRVLGGWAVMSSSGPRAEVCGVFTGKQAAVSWIDTLMKNDYVARPLYLLDPAEVEAELDQRPTRAGLLFESEADRLRFAMRTGGVTSDGKSQIFSGLPMNVAAGPLGPAA